MESVNWPGSELAGFDFRLGVALSVSSAYACLAFQLGVPIQLANIQAVRQQLTNAGQRVPNVPVRAAIATYFSRGADSFGIS